MFCSLGDVGALECFREFGFTDEVFNAGFLKVFRELYCVRGGGVIWSLWVVLETSMCFIKGFIIMEMVFNVLYGALEMFMQALWRIYSDRKGLWSFLWRLQGLFWRY